MFLLILLFFFTNVYLWHDRASQEMDNVRAGRMNSPVSIRVVNDNLTETGGVIPLEVTNDGGVEAVLSRLWITTVDVHSYTDLETGPEIWVAAGETKKFTIHDYYPGFKITFKIITTSGNTAACSCTPHY
jgi:hypothetical protein